MNSEAISPLSIAGTAEDTPAFVQGLGDSFELHGFAVIADHGIRADLIASVFTDTRAFFAQPTEAKMRVHVPGGGGQRGYTPFGVEAAKGAPRADLKEFWHLGRDLPPGDLRRSSMPDNIFVPSVPGFDTDTRKLFDVLDRLGLRVLRGVARYLNLAPGYFDDKVAPGNSILRLLHYPPLAPNAVGMRAAPHEDINVITLLLGAEESGLELLTRGGTWLPVNPPPGAVVVNIGDMLQRLTNNVLPSTSHRVVNPTPERAGYPRYSMPFFQHFASDFLIETLPNCITPTRPNTYPVPITADDFLQERLAEIKLK